MGDDAKVEEVAKRTLRQYDMRNMTLASYEFEGKERTLVLSRHGEVTSDSGLYYDPSTKQCVRYDHLKQEGEVTEDAKEEAKKLEGDEMMEETRKALEKCLEESYMKENYPFGACAVYSSVGSGGKEYAICISSTVYKPRGYWSGRWTSEWILTPEKDQSSFCLKGKCDVATHYYENGNVQFRSNREFAVNDQRCGKDDLAKEVVKSIALEELKYQEDLQESLSDFAETTFKKLRRQLPLTQLKFPWQTGAASLASELMKRETS